jgi:hypothetical protein
MFIFLSNGAAAYLKRDGHLAHTNYVHYVDVQPLQLHRAEYLQLYQPVPPLGRIFRHRDTEVNATYAKQQPAIASPVLWQSTPAIHSCLQSP